MWCWRNGSVVKSTNCSCREPEISSQHRIWWSTTTCNYSSRETPITSLGICICLYKLTQRPHTYIWFKIIEINILLSEPIYLLHPYTVILTPCEKGCFLFSGLNLNIPYLLTCLLPSASCWLAVQDIGLGLQSGRIESQLWPKFSEKPCLNEDSTLCFLRPVITSMYCPAFWARCGSFNKNGAS